MNTNNNDDEDDDDRIPGLDDDEDIPPGTEPLRVKKEDLSR